MFLCRFLSKKDSKSRRKSRTKANSFPGLIRAYGRTDVRTYGRTDVRTYVRDIQIFSASWVTNYMAMDAPHARAFGARGSSAIKHEKVNDFVENLNSCEFLEGLSCYQPFEHITCHLTTFRRPNWPIVSLLFMNGNGWREAAFIVYFSHDIDTCFVLSRYSVLQLESK